jgi:hypothetical protein
MTSSNSPKGKMMAKEVAKETVEALDALKKRVIDGYEQDGSEASEDFIAGVDALIALIIYAHSLED